MNGSLTYFFNSKPMYTGQTEPVDNTLGSAFDGSTGVDVQDILNAPNIGFGSLYVRFSLLPSSLSSASSLRLPACAMYAPTPLP